MEKLTLEHIAPYLPYKMIGKSLGGRMYYLDTFSNMLGEGIENREIGTFLNEQFKPILRLMDLTKPIIVEGEEIIPIVELAKISLTQKFRYGKDWNLEDISFIKSETSTTVKFKEDHSYYRFSGDFNLSNERIGFYLVRDNDIAYYLNQLALFKKLYEWKFDVNGLIEKGLAIDVNTLTTNPYN